MATQLRIYRLDPARVEEFVTLWREQIVPARRAAGFKVQGAWVSRAEAGFAWVISHSGDATTFVEASEAYYDSEARRSMRPAPDEFIVESDTVMVDRLA